MGGDVQTGKQTSQVNNAQINKAITGIGSGINEQLAKDPAVFNKSLFAGAGDTTKNAWATGLAAADNPAYTEGVNGGIDYLSKVARGDYLNAQDPEYKKMVDNTINQTSADVNAALGYDGQTGSNYQTQTLTDSLGNIRLNANVAERQRNQDQQQQALQLLPQAYQWAQQPASIKGAIGAAQDANTQGGLLAEADLFDRTNNADTNQLAQLASILNGTAGSAGTTTSKSVPWWAALLGGASTAAGLSG